MTAIIAVAMLVKPAQVPRPVVVVLCATLITLVFDQLNLVVHNLDETLTFYRRLGLTVA